MFVTKLSEPVVVYNARGSRIALPTAMDQLNKANGWPAMAMDLLMKSEFSTPDEASSSNSNTQDADKCWVCGCPANGRHYGVMACFGCKGFFRRSVQGGKNYTCRHDRNCVIDQNDRNCCRACRFEKCLYVGMDPSAIQPDRDKTGRQRNPRKSQYPGGVIPTQLPLHQQLQMHQQQSTTPDQHPFQDPPSQPCGDPLSDCVPSAMDQVIMDTLVEIEEICKKMKIEISTPYQSLEVAIDKPSTIFTRTMLSFEGHYGPVPPRALHDDILRMCVLMMDYVNTLRPLADVAVSDKVAVVRQCLAPFIVLVVGFFSAQKSDPDTVFLPSGHLLAPSQKFLSTDSDNEEDKSTAALGVRINSVRRSLIEQVISPMRRLEVTEQEMAAVKAILTLDPYAPGISSESAQLLTSGREAVQRALFSHLRCKLPNEDATARFGHLLMIITSVTRVSSQLVSVLHFLKESGAYSDPVYSDLFLYGL